MVVNEDQDRDETDLQLDGKEPSEMCPTCFPSSKPCQPSILVSLSEAPQRLIYVNPYSLADFAESGASCYGETP